MDDLDKQYYKIRDVADMLGVPASTLRYWEKEFPQCAPRRSAGNVRYYKPSDIEQLRIIKYLVKDKGLKIEAAKEQLRVNSGNVSRQQAVIERLQSVRDRLEDLRKALNIRK